MIWKPRAAGQDGYRPLRHGAAAPNWQSKIRAAATGTCGDSFCILVCALSGGVRRWVTRRNLALPRRSAAFLWSPGSTTALNDAELTNHDFRDPAPSCLHAPEQGPAAGGLNLGAEELGGVETCSPHAADQRPTARFTFAGVRRQQRKTSGSYPHPIRWCSSLDSALDPVVEGRSGARTALGPAGHSPA